MNINKFCKKNNIDILNIINIYNKYYYYVKKKYLDLYLQIYNNISISLLNGVIKNINNDYLNGISIRYINDFFTYFISNNNIYNYNFFINKLKKNNNKNKKNIIINNNKNNFFFNYKKIKYEKIIFILMYIYTYIKNNYKQIENINIQIDYCKNIILIINDINNIKYKKDSYIIIKIFIILKNKKKNIYFYINKIFKFYLNINKINILYINKYIKNNIEIYIKNFYKKKYIINFNNIKIYDLVLGPGETAIIFHYVAHALESDFIYKNKSIFSDKLNKKIASSLCTIIDDGSLKNYPGYIKFDDEGIKNSKNILIKNGILKNFLFDKYNSLKMNNIQTGNGRKQFYYNIPIPRITNIYLSPKNIMPNFIINSVNYGIYINKFDNCNFNIKTGNFIFYTNSAYIIKNGILYKSIKNLSISSDIINFMKNIYMIGNDLKINFIICVKNNQYIYIGVGQPTIKIKKLKINIY